MAAPTSHKAPHRLLCNGEGSETQRVAKDRGGVEAHGKEGGGVGCFRRLDVGLGVWGGGCGGLICIQEGWRE